MRTRQTFVYRIEVEYPTTDDGVRLPPNAPGSTDQGYYEDGSEATWPRVRQYLAPRQAEKRAALLLERGAVSAKVVRSLPVEWFLDQ